jgi:ferric-dicitrate binding protein FerR (iron transport regulator)
LDPSQSLSTLDQDLDGVLVEYALVVKPEPKDLMAVQNRDRSDVGFFDSLEHWKQGVFFFRHHSLDLLVSFLNRYQDSTHAGDELRLGFLMTVVIAEGVVVSIRVGSVARGVQLFQGRIDVQVEQERSRGQTLRYSDAERLPSRRHPRVAQDFELPVQE